MNGQEIINTIVRANMPDIEQVRASCLQQAFPRKTVKPLYRRPSFLFAASIAVITVLAVGVIAGNLLLFSGDGENVFVIKTYAYYEMEDDSVELREVVDFEGASLLDDDTLYYTITLMDGGAKSVEIRTSDGILLQQYENAEGHIAAEYPPLIRALLAYSYSEAAGLPAKIVISARFQALDPDELPEGISPDDFAISIGSDEANGEAILEEMK